MSLRDAVMEAAQKYLRFIKSSGSSNVGGPCPFHKGGMEKSPSFYINLDNGLYYCHACSAKGTLPQFLKAMGASAKKIDLVLALAQESAPTKKPAKVTDLSGQFVLKESLLGVFDYCPTKLLNDGFDKALLKRLDIGYDKEYRRITFPIRDLYGRLIGFSGRTTIDEIPRYKVYKSQDLIRFSSGDPEDDAFYRAYDIKNHQHLWNMHNVFPELFYGDLDTIILVEGYKACLWMIQQGFENTVALQGSKMSVTQENILCKFNGTILILLDNNTAGKEGTKDAGGRLNRRGQEVRVCLYPQEVGEGAQPDSLSNEELKETLDEAIPFTRWRNRHE